MPTLVERFNERTSGDAIAIVTKRSRYFSWISGARPPVSRPKIKTTSSAVTERRIPELARRLGREEERLAERRQLTLERVPTGPHAQIDVLPVIEAGAFHLLLIERETRAARSNAAWRRWPGRCGRHCRCSSGSRDERGRRGCQWSAAGGDLGHQDRPRPRFSRPHFQDPQTAAEEAGDNNIAPALILLARTRDVGPRRLGPQVGKPFGSGQERPILLHRGKRRGG